MSCVICGNFPVYPRTQKTPCKNLAAYWQFSSLQFLIPALHITKIPLFSFPTHAMHKFYHIPRYTNNSWLI